MHWNIDDTPIFIAVIDRQGISAAAIHLAISKSKVSKVITRLEEALGVRLLERNSRNIRITSEGQAFYQQCLLINEQVAATKNVMSGLTSKPSGKLVVALPVAFCREFVSRHLEGFYQQYPQITLEIIVTSHPVDIIREQIDIAVVVGTLSDSELIVKPLYEGGLVWITSPAYLANNVLGESVADLMGHLRICETRYASHKFLIRYQGQKLDLDLGGNISYINDPTSVREAVLHGCGVSVLAEQYCKQQLRDGELVAVYPKIGFATGVAKLSAIYPSRRLISNKTRAFLDFLGQISKNM